MQFFTNKKNVFLNLVGIAFLALTINYINCGSVNEDLTEVNDSNENFEPDLTNALGCTTWSQEAFIKAFNANASDYFGRNAVSIFNDRIAIGAFGESSNTTTIYNGNGQPYNNNSANSSGAVYIYAKSGNLWVQQAYIKASNGETYDRFGYSVNLYNNRLIVGAFGESSDISYVMNGPNPSTNNNMGFSGAAYVFAWTGWEWVQQSYIKPPNVGTGDQFGTSVTMWGDRIAIGAPFEDSNVSTVTNGITASSSNGATDSGAVYVFAWNGSTWVQEAYIKPSNTGANDGFGTSLQLDSVTLIVGAPLEDSNISTVMNGSSFTSNNNMIDSGAAYIFKKSISGWSQVAYLKPANTTSGDNFGASVGLSGIVAVVGAPFEDSNATGVFNGSTSINNSATDSGAAYIFQMQNGGAWTQTTYLKASNSQASDLFGFNVAISKNLIAVGSAGEDSSTNTIMNGSSATINNTNNSYANSGAVYLFTRDSGTQPWYQRAYVKASNTSTGDGFGYVSVGSNRLLVGAQNQSGSQNTITNGPIAPATDSLMYASGAAYIYKCN